MKQINTMKTSRDFSPQQITPNQFAEYEQSFWNMAHKAAGRDELYPVLSAAFADTAVEMEKQYYYDFFRWYSYVNWKAFLTLGKSEVVHAFERQIMHAFAFGFDPIQELMQYMLMKCYTHDEAAELFDNCKQAFLRSEAFVNTYKGKDIRVKDIVEMLGFSGREKNSVERAKGYAEALEIVRVPEPYAKMVQYYPVPDSREFVDLFSELASFFVTTEKEDISPLLIHFEFDNLYEQAENSSTEQPLRLERQVPSPQTQSVQKQNTFLVELDLHMTDFTQWINSTNALAQLLAWMKSFANKTEAREQLMNLLQKKFPSIGTDFATASAVIEMDHFLQSNGFTSTEDMVFFDEHTEQFTWNL